MEKLKKLQVLYKKYQLSGCNNDSAADLAVKEVFTDLAIKPYIYKDEYSDPSHVFFQDGVFFFTGGGIYITFK